MTIVYLFYEYLTEGVGGLSHIWEVSENLQRQGHKVVVFAPSCGKYKENKSLEIRYIPTINLRFLRFLSFQLLSLIYSGHYIFRHKVDILYVREMVLSMTPFILSKIFKKPMVTEINGDLLTEYELAGYPQFILIPMRLVEMIVLKASQALVCVTEGLGDILQTRYQIPARKIKVIPNGTNTDLFHPLDPVSCREQLEIDPRAKVVGFVGTFVPHQGLNYLIRSASLILERSPGVIFLLVGDGPMRKNIMDEIHTMDLIDHFILPGAVSQKETALYINAMDVCVAPFTRTRNERMGLSPLKIFDYMACGKPIVASDIKGVGDLLQENEVGIPVTPDDTDSLARGVLLALNDQELASRCLQKSPAFIKKNFTWQTTAQKIAEVCLEAMS